MSRWILQLALLILVALAISNGAYLPEPEASSMSSTPERRIDRTLSQGYPQQLTLSAEMFSQGRQTNLGNHLFDAIQGYVGKDEADYYAYSQSIRDLATEMSRRIYDLEDSHTTFRQILVDVTRATGGRGDTYDDTFYELWAVMVANTATSGMGYMQSFCDFGQFFLRNLPSSKAVFALYAISTLPYFARIDLHDHHDMDQWSNDIMERLKIDAPAVAENFDKTYFVPSMMFQRWTHSLMTKQAPDELISVIFTAWLKFGANLEALTVIAMTLMTRYSERLSQAEEFHEIFEFLARGWHEEYIDQPMLLLAHVNQYMIHVRDRQTALPTGNSIPGAVLSRIRRIPGIISLIPGRVPGIVSQLPVPPPVRLVRDFLRQPHGNPGISNEIYGGTWHISSDEEFEGWEQLWWS